MAENNQLSNLLGQGLQGLAQNKLQQVLGRQQPQQQDQFTEALNQLLKPQQQAPTQLPIMQEHQNLEEISTKKKATPTNLLVPEIESMPTKKTLASTQAGERTKAMIQSRERQNLRKEKQKYIDAARQKADSAKKQNLRLERMEEIIKNGYLPSPSFYTTLSGLEGVGKTPYIGGILGAFAKPFSVLLRAGTEPQTIQDMEEYDKLVNEFVKEAKPYFGGNVSQFDLDAFMKTVPRLSQTNPGKLAIIKNAKILNQMDKVTRKSIDQVLKEHKDEIPKNLEKLVHTKAKPKLEQLSKKFIMDPEIPEIPNRTIQAQLRKGLESNIEKLSPSLANIIRKIP